MKEIPDASVDMVLCDPPYGTTQNDWDVRIDLDQFWTHIKRVTRKGAAILIFTQMPFTAEVVMSNRKMFRYEWIAEKILGTGFLNAHKMPLKCHENILVFYDALPKYRPQYTKGDAYMKSEQKEVIPKRCYREFVDYPARYYENKRFPRDVIKLDWRKEKLTHPTQKPVELCEYFIKTYTDEGETILDPFMGSGTTAVAAMRLNRHFIGWEKEKAFFDIAKERIEAE